MARRRAAAQTAYDLGFEHGADEDAGGGPVPDYIASNSELLAAYDEGLRDGTDSLDGPDARPASRRHHRASGRDGSSSRRRPPSHSASRPPAAEEADRFSASQPAAGGSESSGPRITPTLHFDADNIAGFMFGIGLYAVGINFVRNGPAGVSAWFKAKFFNTVDGQSPAVINDPSNSSTPATPATPATPNAGKVPKLPKLPSAKTKKPSEGRKPIVAPTGSG